MSNRIYQHYSREPSPVNNDNRQLLHQRSKTMAMINLLQPSRSNSVGQTPENELGSIMKEMSQKLDEKSISGNKKTILKRVPSKSQMKIGRPDDSSGLYRLLAENTSSNPTPENQIPLSRERSLPRPLDLGAKKKNASGITVDSAHSFVVHKAINQNSSIMNANSIIQGDNSHLQNRSHKKKTTILHVAKLFPSIKALEFKEKRDDKALDDSFAERNAVEGLEKWTNEYKQALRNHENYVTMNDR